MTLKRILMLMLALTLVFALASCGGQTPSEPDNGDSNAPEDDGTVEYTVTVTTAGGIAVKGATVQLFLDGIVPMKSPVATDEDGQVSFKLTEGDYSAKVITVPDGYELPSAAVTLRNNKATIEIKEYPTYTVYVKNEAGEAVVGAMVQLCSDTGCQMPKATDADGKITVKYVEDNYKALVVSATGYVVTDEYFPLVNGEVTIVLTAE